MSRGLARDIVESLKEASGGQFGGVLVIMVNEHPDPKHAGTLEFDGSSAASQAFSEQGGALIVEFISRANAAIRQIARDLAKDAGGIAIDRSDLLASPAGEAKSREQHGDGDGTIPK